MSNIHGTVRPGYLLLAPFLAACLALPLAAQTEGHYGTGFVTHQSTWLNGRLHLMLLNPSDTQTANVTVSRGGTLLLSDSIPPRGLIEDTWDSVATPQDPICGGWRTTVRHVRIASDIPIAAFQSNAPESIANNDITILVPVSRLGSSYSLAGWMNSGNTGPDYVAVIASSPGPTQVLLTDRAGNILCDVPLVADQVWFLEVDEPDPGLLGWRIDADQPVAVLSGSAATSIGQLGSGQSACCADQLVEAAWPVETLGRTYALAPLAVYPAGAPEPASDLWQIVATEDQTLITTTPDVGGGTLDAGDYLRLVTNRHFSLQASAPVHLVHYSLSLEAESVAGLPAVTPGNGDPAMMLGQAVDQFHDFYMVPTLHEYDENFFVLVQRDGTAVSLNGQELVEPCLPFAEIAGIVWCSRRVEISEGFHVLEGEFPFGGVVFGGESYSSYATTLGWGQSFAGCGKTPANGVSTACEGESAVLEAGPADLPGCPPGDVRYRWVDEDGNLLSSSAELDISSLGPGARVLQVQAWCDSDPTCIAPGVWEINITPDPLPDPFGNSLRLRRPADRTQALDLDWSATPVVAGTYELLRHPLSDGTPTPAALDAATVARSTNEPIRWTTLNSEMGDGRRLSYYKVRGLSECSRRPGPTCDGFPAQVPCP